MATTPPPKRPNAYVVPAPTPAGPPLEVGPLTTEVNIQRAAIQSLHDWVASIYEATTDHTAQLEAAAGHFQQLAGTVSGNQQKTEAAHRSAEIKIEQVLTGNQALLSAWTR